jgi:mannose-6-phosphate isomerase-like protein (cupin superfamily)
MPLYIEKPVVIPAVGNKPKLIEEFFGRISSSTNETSIAHMKSPDGWIEPGQTPEFNEYTIVLKGALKVMVEKQRFIVTQGQAILTFAGEWVQYSSPFVGGAEYISVCVPAFSSDSARRDVQKS